jgi:hypothetical protein
MAKSGSNALIKALGCDINLGESILDAYMLPSGEKRIGIENTGAALGYTSKVFFQKTKRQSETLKALQDKGFSGEQTWVIRQDEDNNEASLAKTISIRDFVKLVTYEAITNRNTKAIVLLAAFAETGMEKILEEAFAGRSIDFILEKIVHFNQWTYKEYEEVLTYNREEVRALYGWEPPQPLA